jgi:hypothetical protein
MASAHYHHVVYVKSRFTALLLDKIDIFFGTNEIDNIAILHFVVAFRNNGLAGTPYGYNPKFVMTEISRAERFVK